MNKKEKSDSKRPARPALSLVMFIESYVFQGFFLYFIYQAVSTLTANHDRLWALFRSVGQQPMTYAHLILLSDTLFVLVLIFFDFMVAYSLYIRKNLREHPKGFFEIVIPTLGTFGAFLYNLVPFFSQQMNYLVIPQEYLAVVLPIGSLLSLMGVTIGAWAVLNLRESFGIFVQVRDIVMKGPYRYVRHPMYLGHILIDIGFFLIYPRVYTLVLSIGVISLNLCRAFLEERKLAHVSPEYKSYQQTTPFLFPWKFRP